MATSDTLMTVPCTGGASMVSPVFRCVRGDSSLTPLSVAAPGPNLYLTAALMEKEPYHIRVKVCNKLIRNIFKGKKTA